MDSVDIQVNNNGSFGPVGLEGAFSHPEGGGGPEGGGFGGDNEVFTTPNGSTSVVVLEEEEVPERPNPPLKPRMKSTRDRRNQREVVTQEMLPADELLNFVDLEQLANPDKMVVENKEEQKGPPPSPPGSRRKEAPVPAKFPPPPSSSGPKGQRNPPAAKGSSKGTSAPSSRKGTADSSNRRREKEPSPKRPSPPKESSQRGPWNSEFEVHEQEDEAEIFEYHPPGSKRRAQRFFDDDDDDDQPPPPSLQARERRHHSPPARGPPTARGPERRRERRDAPRDMNGIDDNEEEDSAANEPKISPEELRKRRKEDEEREKMQLLYKLYQYEQRGYRMANSYSMESNIDELRFEVSKIRNEDSARHSVKWYKVFLMIVVSSVETLNKKFDPFGLRLNGWSRDMNAKKDDLDDCFHRLHEKYSQKTAIEPELELAFAFFGGAFMYHLQNAADNFGELGNLVNAITGGPAGSSGPSNQSGQSGLTGQRGGPAVMTNMHFPPSQAGQVPSAAQSTMGPQGPHGGTSNSRPKRRVMKPPDIPNGAAEIASMMPMMMERQPPEEEDYTDVPIDFNLPKSVGGARPRPSESADRGPPPAVQSRSRPIPPPPSSVSEERRAPRKSPPSGGGGGGGASSSSNRVPRPPKNNGPEAKTPTRNGARTIEI